MQPQQTDPQLQLEALRRRADQLPSSAGVVGGAPAANNLGPQNPIPQDQMTSPPPFQGGANGIPSGGAQQRLKAEKGESRTLVDALIYRLKNLTTRGQ